MTDAGPDRQTECGSDAALVERCLDRPRWALTFPQTLEERFLREGAPRRRWIVTAFGMLAIGFFLALAVPDHLMTPSALPFAWWMRLLVFPAIIVSGLVWVHWQQCPRLLERLVALAGMLAACLEVLILCHADHPWAYPRLVELNIVVVFVCAIARFKPAMAVCLFTLLTHGLGAFAMTDPTGVLGVSTFVLLGTTAAFALSATFKLERDERMAFLLDVREQALASELQQVNERLARAATSDPLTGVANRRAFDAFLSESWSRSVAQERPLGLIALDIDWFKRYNDHLGHQAGDRCLISVAQAVQSCLRRTGDLVARVGGEEFAVIMVDAEPAAVGAAAQRIRQAVDQLALPHATSVFRRVTVSVGVATHTAESSVESMSALIEAADAALYRAKESGRNTVVDALDRGQEAA